MLVISILVFCPFLSTGEDLLFYNFRSKSFILLSLISVDPSSLLKLVLVWLIQSI